MYGYAKRPRERAANRLRPDAQTTRPGETKPNSSMITWRRVGLEFIDENGGGPAVRLKKSPKGKDRK